MLVFNISNEDLVYRGRTIRANGGSHDFRDLTFVPPRDLANRRLAFDQLPTGWSPSSQPKVEQLEEFVQRSPEAQDWMNKNSAFVGTQPASPPEPEKVEKKDVKKK
jgi:hypothetical protein